MEEGQQLVQHPAIAHELECLAFITKAKEREQRAAMFFGAAANLRETISIPMTPLERLEYDREVNDLPGNVEAAAFERAWSDGRALSMEQAIALVLENGAEQRSGHP